MVFAWGPVLFEFHFNCSLFVKYFWCLFILKKHFFLPKKKFLGSEHFTWAIVAEGTWGKIPTMWTYFMTVEDLNFMLFISHKCMCVCGGGLAGGNSLGLLLTDRLMWSMGTPSTSEASLFTPCPIPSQPHRPSSGCSGRLPSALCSCYSSLLGMLFLPSPHPICTWTLWLTNSYPSLKCVASSDHSSCGAMEGLGTPTMEPHIFTLVVPVSISCYQ